MDLGPTFLDLADTAYPATRNGKPVEQPRGRSIRAFLSGERPEVRGQDEPLGMEYNNLKTMRIGDYKVTWIPAPYGPGEWQIFDLSVDPGESRDLSAQHPDLKRQLIAAWDEYAESVGVIAPNNNPLAGE